MQNLPAWKSLLGFWFFFHITLAAVVIIIKKNVVCGWQYSSAKCRKKLLAIEYYWKKTDQSANQWNDFFKHAMLACFDLRVGIPSGKFFFHDWVRKLNDRAERGANALNCNCQLVALRRINHVPRHVIKILCLSIQAVMLLSHGNVSDVRIWLKFSRIELIFQEPVPIITGRFIIQRAWRCTDCYRRITIYVYYIQIQTA